MSMSVKEILALGRTQLAKCGDADADVDSKLLYCWLMKVPRDRLFMEYQIILSDEPCEKYFRVLDRRCAGEPLQYITGSTSFMGLDFEVDPRVLIPRPETEILVEQAAMVLNDNKLQDEPLDSKPKKSPEVLDLCSGSGAIGLSIAKLCPKAKVTLSDASKEAMEVARKNAGTLRVSVGMETGDLFEPFRGRFHSRSFDIILTNPPYIPTKVIPTLQKEVRDFEPKAALDGGADGLAFYRRIASEAQDFLKEDGILMMEIGADQKDAVTALLRADGAFPDIRCIPDLAGHDRVIFAQMIGKARAKAQAKAKAKAEKAHAKAEKAQAKAQAKAEKKKTRAEKSQNVKDQ